MTEAAPATGGLPQQEPRNEGATFEDTTFASNGTTRGVATREANSIESEHDVTESQHHPTFPSTAMVTTSNFIWYRNAAVQTLPPNDAKEFQKIYDRAPTNQELVSKIGSAGIGRYVSGPSANPHDVVLGSPFATATVSKRRPNYSDSSFQTDDAAQRNKYLLRAKVKASLLVNKQRDAALSAGFRVWSETRDNYIIHSEQLQISVQFDTQGNAIDANVVGLSLPNIYGEEMGIDKEAKGHASSATSVCTPPPKPPSALLYNTFGEVSHPQRIRTVEPHVPSEKSDPVPIEYYGYIERIPTEATERSTGGEEEQHNSIASKVRKQDTVREDDDRSEEVLRKKDTIMVIGGDRFADEYIVHDAPISPARTSTTTSDTNTKMSKKRKSENKWDPERAATSTKRPKTSPTCNDSPEAGTSTHKDYFPQYQEEYAERNDAKSTQIDHTRTSEDQTLPQIQHAQVSTPRKKYEDEAGAEDERKARSSPAYWSARHRSRSPGDRHSSDRYKLRSSVERRAEDLNGEERQRYPAAREMESDSRTQGGYTDMKSQSRGGKNSDAQKKDVDEIISARKKEDDRRLQHAQRIEQQGLAKRQKQEEAEIQRAREAKNQRKLEIEERKQAQEYDRQRRQEEKDRNRRRQRDGTEAKSRKEHRQTVKQEVEPSEPVDPYVVAREAEAKRRELAFAARGAGEADSRGQEPSSARNEGFSRLEVERPKPEKKIEDKKVTKPRPSRTPRGELERYDPRKKFGGGR